MLVGETKRAHFNVTYPFELAIVALTCISDSESHASFEGENIGPNQTLMN